MGQLPGTAEGAQLLNAGVHTAAVQALQAIGERLRALQSVQRLSGVKAEPEQIKGSEDVSWCPPAQQGELCAAEHKTEPDAQLSPGSFIKSISSLFCRQGHMSRERPPVLHVKPAATELGNALLRPALCLQTQACLNHGMHLIRQWL